MFSNRFESIIIRGLVVKGLRSHPGLVATPDLHRKESKMTTESIGQRAENDGLQ